MMDKNRRHEPRFSISQLIEMSFGRERWVRAQLIDISRNGFRARLSDELDTGSSMYVLFSVDEKPVQVEAVAVHVSHVDDEIYEAGFQFSIVDSKAKAAIEAYIESIAAES